MKKQLSYFLVLNLVLVAGSKEVRADDWGKNLLIAGGIVAGIGGAITAANWLFSESDDQLVLRAADMYRDTVNRYRSLLDVYATVYQQGYDEDGLYRLACVIWDTGKDQSSYRSAVSSAKNTLRSLRDALSKRINKLAAYVNNYETRLLVGRMRESLQYIEQLLPYMESVSRYLYKHRHYFDLFSADGRIRNVYQSLMDELSAYRHDGYQVMMIIKRYAVYTAGGRYPLTNFATVLQEDMRELKSALRSADSRYYNRILCGQQLLDALSHIFTTLCSDPEYAQQYYQLQQERREQERLELQRQQAQFERERLRNEQQRLDLERQRLYAEQSRRSKVRNNETASDVHLSLNVTL